MNIEINTTVALGIIFLVSSAWFSLLAKLIRGREIIAFAPRQDVPWGLIAVATSFFLFIGSQIAVGLAFNLQPGIELSVEQTASLYTWTAVGIPAAMIVSMGLIYLFARADHADFGISLKRFPHDLVVGCYAFLILGPITFLIQFIFVGILKIESHHPLIEELQQDSTGRLFGIISFLAVVVAPISEEYFFRVVLQGWLEKCFHVNGNKGFSTNRASNPDVADFEATELRRASDHADFTDMHIPMNFRPEDGKVFDLTASAIPIIISAAVFALMHWSHGPDPAALFVLALGLGYVYRQTHRWLPCVATHACLNGTTMLMLWFSLDQLPT